jgi:hypothetical protein
MAAEANVLVSEMAAAEARVHAARAKTDPRLDAKVISISSSFSCRVGSQGGVSKYYTLMKIPCKINNDEK